MTHDCFTYGTLMSAEIMRHVSGRRFNAEPATLPDHSRHPVRDAPYPGIRTNPGQSVHGVLYRGVDSLALNRLDAFEGSQYERRTVRVITGDGREKAAQAYVFKPALNHLLLPGDWDYEQFLAHAARRFRRHYFGD